MPAQSIQTVGPIPPSTGVSTVDAAINYSVSEKSVVIVVPNVIANQNQIAPRDNLESNAFTQSAQKTETSYDANQLLEFTIEHTSIFKHKTYMRFHWDQAFKVY